MKILLVDDEAPARARLTRLLGGLGQNDVLEAESAAAALGQLRAHPIDLVLLDVNMPGMDGLSLAALERLPPVVFVTGDPAHAARAFDVEAVDFLTKPVSAERLARALERAQRTAAVPASSEPPIRLRVIDADKERFVDLRGVELFRAEHKYVAFRLGAEELLVRESLDELEALLAPHGFLRVHRGALVRLDAIAALDGESVTLASGAAAPVSRRSLPALRARLRAR